MTGKLGTRGHSLYIYLRPGRMEEGPPEPQASIREVQVDNGRGEVAGRPQGLVSYSLVSFIPTTFHPNQQILTRNHLSQESLASNPNPNAPIRGTVISAYLQILPPSVAKKWDMGLRKWLGVKYLLCQVQIPRM